MLAGYRKFLKLPKRDMFYHMNIRKTFQKLQIKIYYTELVAQ